MRNEKEAKKRLVYIKVLNMRINDRHAGRDRFLTVRKDEKSSFFFFPYLHGQIFSSSLFSFSIP